MTIWILLCIITLCTSPTALLYNFNTWLYTRKLNPNPTHPLPEGFKFGRDFDNRAARRLLDFKAAWTFKPDLVDSGYHQLLSLHRVKYWVLTQSTHQVYAFITCAGTMGQSLYLAHVVKAALIKCDVGQDSLWRRSEASLEAVFHMELHVSWNSLVVTNGGNPAHIHPGSGPASDYRFVDTSCHMG